MENFKKQFESIYLPKLKTQRVREKNLNYQCSKEREKTFKQTHPCKWVEVESCLLGQSATDLNGVVEPLCRVHCVVVVLMFVKQWRRKSLLGFFLFWRETEVFYDREVEWGRRRGTGEIENQNLVFCIFEFYVLSGFC